MFINFLSKVYYEKLTKNVTFLEHKFNLEKNNNKLFQIKYKSVLKHFHAHIIEVEKCNISKNNFTIGTFEGRYIVFSQLTICIVCTARRPGDDYRTLLI